MSRTPSDHDPRTCPGCGQSAAEHFRYAFEVLGPVNRDVGRPEHDAQWSRFRAGPRETSRIVLPEGQDAIAALTVQRYMDAVHAIFDVADILAQLPANSLVRDKLTIDGDMAVVLLKISKIQKAFQKLDARIKRYGTLAAYQAATRQSLEEDLLDCNIYDVDSLLRAVLETRH